MDVLIHVNKENTDILQFPESRELIKKDMSCKTYRKNHMHMLYKEDDGEVAIYITGLEDVTLYRNGRLWSAKQYDEIMLMKAFERVVLDDGEKEYTINDVNTLMLWV